MTDVRRALPAVHVLLERPRVRDLLATTPRTVVLDAVRAVLDRLRSSGSMPNDVALDDAIATEVALRSQPSLRAAFNATGVVLHTNLGRAPLARAAIEAIGRTAAGASNLEYDLARGARGSRYGHCVTLLCELTAAEDAIVVNNCAAALVLALNTFADGRGAIVSRGELIEIGGSFRVPDIMAKSGAKLIEVGTTNRTHADDYRRALTSDAGAIVKVHRSNFEVRGFVAEATLTDLAPIAREGTIPLLFDFGSGLLVSLEPFGLSGEPTARDGVQGGATLTLMSGDKLLGGPQAGIIVGEAAAVSACRRNPLARAVRVDKLTLAALEATLQLYRDPERAVREVPVLAMLSAEADVIRQRAARIAGRLTSTRHRLGVEASVATVGGGAFPTARIPSYAIVLSGGDAATEIEARLRANDPPIIGRLADDRVWLDLRSILPEHDDAFAAALERAIA
ncbi:MAG TPA: L-seryl-tRNA(Sec) selenium transferase [Gemmatimonadaceae bacterium]|nr:L-seryl-tRNA(Sec) selenium transferase [Gemmatimonadaceae bacterium]